MRIPGLRRVAGAPRGVANLARLHLRSHGWRFHPRRFSGDLDAVPIHAPVFLLGIQGGGLTLVSRMLRRHPHVVSVTGNASYWAGPDEMQNVMGPILPAELTGLRYRAPFHPVYRERASLYAIDELLPLYRRTSADVSESAGRRLRKAIRLAISMYGSPIDAARFVDKSQTFTVRLGLVNALLRGHEPHFVLVTRNPFATCYRAAMESTPVSRLPLSAARRLELAAEHWENSFRCALEDAGPDVRCLTLRFEDLLQAPERWLATLADFVGLDHRSSMIPSTEHRLPLGSTGSARGDRKWFPLRPDVNAPYLKHLEPWMADIIERRAGLLATRWGYTPEGP